MDATERRAELLAMGRELIAVMREIIEPINKIACRLDAEASLLTAESADETLSGTRTKKKIVYRETTREAVESAIVASKEPGTWKRACSKCRKPGHRATTCPNAS